MNYLISVLASAVGERMEELREYSLEGPLTTQAVRKFERQAAIRNRLVLNYARGFDGRQGVGALAGARVTHLSIIDHSLRDLEGLETLSGLRSLDLIVDPSIQVDLASFPELQMFSGHWQNVAKSVSSGAGSNLRYLHLLEFKETDLMALELCTGLRLLELKDRTRLQSLHGIRRLDKLERLSIFNVADLVNLSDLGMSTGLRKLEIDGASKLTEIPRLTPFKRLNSLTLSNCGDLKSLTPLAEVATLRELDLSGSTKVVDADLAPLLRLTNLKEFVMKNRRGYRPTVREVLNYHRIS